MFLLAMIVINICQFYQSFKSILILQIVARKHIAEESAKMLKLKEEGVKLTQRFKIVATELRNIKTAITLNKRQQRSVQTCLTKIRLNHQALLKRYFCFL